MYFIHRKFTLLHPGIWMVFFLLFSCNPTYYISYDLPDDARLYLSDEKPFYIADTMFFNEDIEYLGKGSGKHPMKKKEFKISGLEDGYAIIEADDHELNIESLNYTKSGRDLKIKNNKKGDKLEKRPETSLKVEVNQVNFINSYKEGEEGITTENIFSRYYHQKKLSEVVNKSNMESALNSFVSSDLYLRDYRSDKKLGFGKFRELALLNIDFDLYNIKKPRYYYYTGKVIFQYNITTTLLNASGDTIISKSDDYTADNVRYLKETLLDLVEETLFDEKVRNSAKNLEAQLNQKINNWEMLSLKSCPATPHTFKRTPHAVVTIFNDKRQGSGIILGENGYIVTNQHILGIDDTVKVITHEGAELHASVIRANPYYDLALLKCDTRFKTGLAIDENKYLNFGDVAYTVGTPVHKALKGSVSKGIITGSRKIDDLSFYQTNASVNGGNSGGPLVDQNGELIGVVNAKLIGYGVKKMGFAIPNQMIKKALKVEFN